MTRGEADQSGWGIWAADPGSAASFTRADTSVTPKATRAPEAVGDATDEITTRVCVRPGQCVDEAIAHVTTNPTAKAAPQRAVEPGRSDIAQFLVGTPGVRVEPAAWTVAGAETNFMATSAGERSQSGTLLGQPVTVNFVPVSYRWVYGDGVTRQTSVPGASWQASVQPPFAATPTSHVFATRGSYSVTVTVEFAAQYRFAGADWRAIPGTVALTSRPLTVNVKSVTTVLVGHNCDERPAGPGCSL